VTAKLRSKTRNETSRISPGAAMSSSAPPGSARMASIAAAGVTPGRSQTEPSFTRRSPLIAT
jgi:hypothetical protein